MMKEFPLFPGFVMGFKGGASPNGAAAPNGAGENSFILIELADSAKIAIELDAGDLARRPFPVGVTFYLVGNPAVPQRLSGLNGASGWLTWDGSRMRITRRLSPLRSESLL
jgi:hypothetical protein